MNGLDPITLAVVLGVMALLPTVVVVTTSFMKISVVIMLVRNALGVQQIPPNMALYGLSLILTAYTVLVEGDDMTEPVADEMRSLLDVHIVLSRKLGAAAHYPAVDVLASVSRVMGSIVTPQHRKSAERLRELMAAYAEVELLVRVGEYQKGGDPLVDEAIAKQDRIRAFLRQGTMERTPMEQTLAQLQALARG